MKKSLFIGCVLALLLTINFACSKSDTKECEAQNYGTITVTYSSSSTASLRNLTSILTGNTFLRNKEIALGGKVDTLRLKPGTYSIKLDKLSNSGLIIFSKTVSATVTACSETALAE